MIAHKSFTGSIVEAEEDGTLSNINGDFPFRQGELLFVNLNGHVEIVNKKYIEDNFIVVEPKKKKVDIKQMMENYNQDWVNNEDYIF